MRRSLIAVTAVGGTLALAASASAIPVPIGNSTDAPYSGSGTPTSVFSLYNQADQCRPSSQPQVLIQLTNAVDVDQSLTPVDASFTSTAGHLIKHYVERRHRDRHRHRGVS